MYVIIFVNWGYYMKKWQRVILIICAIIISFIIGFIIYLNFVIPPYITSVEKNDSIRFQDKMIINIYVDNHFYKLNKDTWCFITNKDDDICDYLLKELNLGITLIDTRGGFTNNKDQIIMCVVPTNDYFKVSEGIKLIDPEAVVLVTDAYQTSGVYTGKTKEA